MNIINISLQHVQIFLLIFLRVTSIIIFIPIFDNKNIPVIIKAGLSFSISIILFPFLDIKPADCFSGTFPFVIGAFSEILLGIIIGFSAKMIFSGIQLAGQMAGIQMGLGLDRVLDPNLNTQISSISQFGNLFAILIFLTINAHHWFLKALLESFKLVPPFGFQFSTSVMNILITLSTKMFIVSIKVGAPVMAALLLTSVAFGLIARTVPQMHIMIVALPLKIFVGLLTLGLILPFLSSFFIQIFNDLGKEIFLLLHAM